MTAGGRTLDDARRELYAGPQATFVERRKELAAEARSGGDKDLAKLIGALRKPTAAAHVVNLLAHAGDSSLHELVELGASIRGAMADGDGEMRSLLQGRAAAIATTLAQARKIARANGETVSGAVGDQIAQILRAAMASEESAAAVLGGALTDALDEPGFGGISIEPAVHPSPKPAARRTIEVPSSSDTAAERAAAEKAERAAAKARIASANADVKRAEQAVSAAVKQRDGLARDRDRLALQLAQIEDELTAAGAAVDEAEAELATAAAELEAARNDR